MCIDIRGCINNRSFKGFKNKDGSRATAKQVEHFMLDQLAMGRKVVPMGDCDNFDYQTGCKGHPVTDQKASD